MTAGSVPKRTLKMKESRKGKAISIKEKEAQTASQQTEEDRTEMQRKRIGV